jgi:hypothetical protein
LNGKNTEQAVTPGVTTTSGTITTPTVATGQAVMTLDYQNESQSATTNQIQMALQFTNTGNSPLALANVTARYWYVSDTSQQQVVACDYATIDCQNVQSQIVKMSTPQPNADTYLEIGFKGGELPAGASIEVKLRIHKSDWSNYDQSNDYSFVAGANNYIPAQRMALYYNGELIGGSEPA